MTGLTTEERKVIRENLLDQGFTRVSPTFLTKADPEEYRDKGDGAYKEDWSGPGNTRITLTWQPKRVPPEPVYGMCTACGAVEVELNRATGTRDLSGMGESAKYPTGYGCEVCS